MAWSVLKDGWTETNHLSLCRFEVMKTSNMTWTSYDCLNKFQNFYMTVVVDIIRRCGLGIEACYGNQLGKIKLTLFKPLFSFYSYLVIKLGVVYI